MRRNRRDPKDRDHDTLWANPGGFTRAARRAVGYRRPVALLTEEHEGLVVNVEDQLPRSVRRHVMQAAGPQRIRRNRRWRTRLRRLLEPWGLTPV